MDLAEPHILRAFLRKHGLEPKKGLGQHFLCSPKVVLAIVEACLPAESALEIGPGPGILTSALATRIPNVGAIELDQDMLAALAESAPSVQVIQANAMEVDWSEVLGAMPKMRALVSNLPYYITGPLLTRAALAKEHFDQAVFMMQKEVADRILAKPADSNRGSLSVFLQLQFRIEKVIDVPPGSFLPPPKVSSTVLKFVPLDGTDRVNMTATLARLIRMSFRMPRKTLANNLIAAQFGTREAIESALAALQLDHRIRPQFLENHQWPDLCRALGLNIDEGKADDLDID